MRITILFVNVKYIEQVIHESVLRNNEQELMNILFIWFKIIRQASLGENLCLQSLELPVTDTSLIVNYASLYDATDNNVINYLHSSI